MTERRLETSAHVELTLVIDGRSCWRPDCTVEQVEKQAAEEALDTLRKSFPSMHLGFGARVIGTPIITVVTARRAHDVPTKKMPEMKPPELVQEDVWKGYEFKIPTSFEIEKMVRNWAPDLNAATQEWIVRFVGHSALALPVKVTP